MDTHDSVVEDMQSNARKNYERNYVFLDSLIWVEYGFDTDKVAKQLTQEAFQIIDCTRCANCCKVMTPKFKLDEVERISGYLNIPTAEVISKYLKQVPSKQGVEDHYVSVGCDDEGNRKKPCSFLGEDNRCTIYEVRPEACEEFPYTHKENFADRKKVNIRNSTECPIVFWIVEQMGKKVLGSEKDKAQLLAYDANWHQIKRDLERGTTFYQQYQQSQRQKKKQQRKKQQKKRKK